MRVLDEIVLRHGTTEQACEEFLKRFPNHHGGRRGVRRRIGKCAADDRACRITR